MPSGSLDWNWFFSSLAQSVAALVGIFAAFIITKIVNNQAEFKRKNARLKELLSVTEKYRDALFARSFDWYNERRLEYALERLESVPKDEDFKSSEEYYEEFNFPDYLPRSEVLTKIEEKVDDERQKRKPRPRNRDDFSYLYRPDVAALRIETQIDQQIRQNVTAEGERIRSLILEIRHHIRLVRLHLAELDGNPESSRLISLSIIGAVLLLILGVICPLSFLPANTNPSISTSIRVFIPGVFSLKGFLLGSVSVVFLAIMVTFWRVNHSLKYEPEEIDALRRAEVIESYSEYLRVMTQNQREQRDWSEGKNGDASITGQPEAVP